MNVITKGLDLPIAGTPSRVVERKVVEVFGLTGADFNGMKPSFLVNEGDFVNKGQPIFTSKIDSRVKFVSPASGQIIKISRGDRRLFQTVAVKSDLTNTTFFKLSNYKGDLLDSYSREELALLLAESGLWVSFRTRPFSKLPRLDKVPSSIFVTAIDTNPLAPDPGPFLREFRSAFNDGLDVLNALTDGKLYVCVKGGFRFDISESKNREICEFSGPHPSGNVGTHIHFIDPVGTDKEVWHIGYQDVVSIGKLLATGKYFNERWVSIAGPEVMRPRVVKTNLGANLNEFLDGEVTEDVSNLRVISGSVFSGRTFDETFKFLGQFANQVTVLREDRERKFLGWHDAGIDRFSVMRTFVSKLFPNKKFNFGTSRHGSYRAIVPVGAYEKVMPLDILSTQLLKALVAKDTDQAQLLGCLELDEEDLSLCTFVDPGKVDYGPLLRESLTQIEKDG